MMQKQDQAQNKTPLHQMESLILYASPNKNNNSRIKCGDRVWKRDVLRERGYQMRQPQKLEPLNKVQNPKFRVLNPSRHCIMMRTPPRHHLSMCHASWSGPYNVVCDKIIKPLLRKIKHFYLEYRCYIYFLTVFMQLYEHFLIVLNLEFIQDSIYVYVVHLYCQIKKNKKI